MGDVLTLVATIRPPLHAAAAQLWEGLALAMVTAAWILSLGIEAVDTEPNEWLQSRTEDSEDTVIEVGYGPFMGY